MSVPNPEHCDGCKKRTVQMSVPNPKEWGDIFNEVFDELKGCKIHESAHSSFTAQNALRYSAKDEGSYCCESCKRNWHSINALAEFEYRLEEKRGKREGHVKLVLNGQSCKKVGCNKSVFIKPLFGEEAIQRILEKLLIKVKQKFYEVDDGENLEQRFGALMSFRPQGSGSHSPEHCEACKKGICQSKETVPRYNNRRRVTHGRNTGMGSDIYVKWYIHM